MTTPTPDAGLQPLHEYKGALESSTSTPEADKVPDPEFTEPVLMYLLPDQAKYVVASLPKSFGVMELPEELINRNDVTEPVYMIVMKEALL